MTISLILIVSTAGINASRSAVTHFVMTGLKPLSSLLLRASRSDASATHRMQHRRLETFGAWRQLGADIDDNAQWGSTGLIPEPSVALSADGTRLAICAYGSRSSGNIGYEAWNTRKGHVRVYEWSVNTSSWVQLGAEIYSEGMKGSDNFALSADGTHFAIATFALNAGQVLVYEWSVGSNAWVQLGNHIDAHFEGRWFGTWLSISLSADGTRVAIGSHGRDGYGNEAQYTGRARVYELSVDSSSWAQLQPSAHIVSLDTVSLSADGMRLAVSGKGNNNRMLEWQGMRVVRVYEWIVDERAWVQLGADIEGEWYQASTHLSWRTRLAISADGAYLAISEGSSFLRKGRLRVMHWSTDTSGWVQVGNHFEGKASYDKYLGGCSVSLSADGMRLAIGADHSLLSRVTMMTASYMRVYEWSPSTSAWTQLGADIHGDSTHDASGSVSISARGTRIAITGLPVRVYELNASTPTNASTTYPVYPETKVARAHLQTFNRRCIAETGAPCVPCSDFGPHFEASVENPAACTDCSSNIQFILPILSVLLLVVLIVSFLYFKCCLPKAQRYPVLSCTLKSAFTLVNSNLQNLSFMTYVSFDWPAWTLTILRLFTFELTPECVLKSSSEGFFWEIQLSICIGTTLLLFAPWTVLLDVRSRPWRQWHKMRADIAHAQNFILSNILFPSLWTFVKIMRQQHQTVVGNSNPLIKPALIASYVMISFEGIFFVLMCFDVFSFHQGKYEVAEAAEEKATEETPPAEDMAEEEKATGEKAAEEIAVEEKAEEALEEETQTSKCIQLLPFANLQQRIHAFLFVWPTLPPRDQLKRVEFLVGRWREPKQTKHEWLVKNWQFVIWSRQALLLGIAVAGMQVTDRQGGGLAILEVPQIVCAYIVIFVSFYLQCKFKPYKYDIENNMEKWLLGLTGIIILLAPVYATNTPQVRQTFEVILVIVLIMMLIETVRYLIRRTKDAHKALTSDLKDFAAVLLEQTRHNDKKLAEAIERGDIRLLRCSWILKIDLDKMKKMERQQDLPEEAFFPPKDAADLLRRGDRSVFALSYGWQSKCDPDPCGDTLKAIQRHLGATEDLEHVRQAARLDLLRRSLSAGPRKTQISRTSSFRRTSTSLLPLHPQDQLLPVQDCALFWDFASLPQKEYTKDGEKKMVEKPRTKEEEKRFKRALDVMGLLYASILGTAVLQYKKTADDAPNSTPYNERGWCIFEEAASMLVEAHLVQAAKKQDGDDSTRHLFCIPCTKELHEYRGNLHELFRHIRGSRHKVTDISETISIEQSCEQQAEQILEQSIASIKGAKFTGKADKPKVCCLLYQLEWNILKAIEKTQEEMLSKWLSETVSPFKDWEHAWEHAVALVCRSTCRLGKHLRTSSNLGQLPTSYRL